MENSSNALILIGEILIAVLVISFLAYMFITFGNFSRNMNVKMTESQLSEFNDHFFRYQYRTNITAQEIASVINFAKQSNDNYELSWNDDSEYYVEVYIDGDNFFHSYKYINSRSEYENNINQIVSDFIEDNNEIYFSCCARVTGKNADDTLKVDYNYNDIKINDGKGESGMVYEIRFSKVDKDVINVLTDNKFNKED